MFCNKNSIFCNFFNLEFSIFRSHKKLQSIFYLTPIKCQSSGGYSTQSVSLIIHKNLGKIRSINLFHFFIFSAFNPNYDDTKRHEKFFSPNKFFHYHSFSFRRPFTIVFLFEPLLNFFFVINFFLFT